MKARFEWVVLAIFLAVCVCQLFVPPLIGIADNGDFERMRIPNGISRMPTEATDQRFNYVISKFAVVPKPDVGIYYYHSSTHLFVAVARWLNVTFVSRELFDVRVMGAVYTVSFLAGVYLILVFSRPWEFKWRCLLAAALLLMFTDIAYTAFFNSFYSEPTAFVALFFLVGCALLLMRGRASVLTLMGYFAAAAILVTAKPMYVPFALLFAPLGMYLSRSVARYRYAWSAAMTIALVLLAVGYQLITPNWLKMKASYIAIFGYILPESPNPDADMRAMNLKPEWKRLIGTTPYDADGPVETDPKFPGELMARVHTLSIPKFLLTHPAQLYRIASEVAPQMMVTLPDYAGYYEESAGKPPRSKPVAYWSNVRARIFPSAVWLLTVYFVSGGVAFLLALRRQTSELTRGLLFLYTVLVAFSAEIYLVSIVSMASIDTRYSSTFVAALDLNMILAVGLLIRAKVSRAS